ncbi:MAG: hypothetical protein ABIL06_00345 [Pseudomonadota bacterium]
MFRHVIKWLLWFIVSVLLIVILAATGLFFTPKIVSTQWFKHQIETHASKVLHRPVTLKDLQWTWHGGIRAEGLRIEDDPSFFRGPLISVDDIVLTFDLQRRTHRRLSLDFQLKGIEAHLIRGADGRTNLKAWLSQLTSDQGPAAPADPSQKGDWLRMTLALLGHIQVRFRLENGAIEVNDRVQRRSLKIHDITLQLDTPSLIRKPITLNLSSRQEMDGKALPPLELSLHLQDLMDATPALNLKTASVQIESALPGLRLNVKGELSKMGVEAKAALDLAPLTDTVKALFPPSFPTLSGRAELATKATLNTDESISFDFSFKGEELTVMGGPLKEKRLGPFSVRVSQTGRAKPSERLLDVTRGEIRLQEKTHLTWHGRVKAADTSGLETDLTINDVSVDLGEVQGLTGEFIPAGIRFSRHQKTGFQGVKTREVHLSGTFPSGPAGMDLKGFSLHIPGLAIAFSKNTVSLENLSIRVPNAKVRLNDRFPTELNIRADIEMKKVHLSGTRSVRFDGLKLASVQMTATDLARSDKALLGIAGKISLQETGRFEGVDISSTAKAPQVTHALDASIHLPASPGARVISARASVSAPSLQLDSVSKRPLRDGINLEARVNDLNLMNTNPLMVDVGAVEAGVHSGDLVDLKIKGVASALGKKDLRMEGHLGLDLEQATALIPAHRKPDGRFSGRVEANWRYLGRLPTTGELQKLSDKKLPLVQKIRAVDFMKKMDLEVRLKDVAIDLPLKQGAAFSARGINSLTPLTVQTSKGLDSLALGGKLTFQEISELPSLGKQNPPLGVTLSLTAKQQDLTTVEVTESMHVEPLQMDQTLRLSLNKLNRLLKGDVEPGLQEILKHLEGSVSGGLEVNLDPQFAKSKFTRGISLKGPLKAGLEITLAGGEAVSVQTSLKSTGMDVATDKGTEIRGLKSDIRIGKAYRIRFDEKEKGMPKSGSRPLSLQVLRPKGGPPGSGTSTTLTKRLMEDLRGRLNRTPSLSFHWARLQTGPFPIEITNYEMQLRLAGSLPAIDYFQCDILGGTLLGDLRISRQGDLYLLQMSGAFSGLDARQLLAGGLPSEKKPGEGPAEDTQMSGQMSLQSPISEDSLVVTNNLNATIRLTHIGSRAMERLLYAMDPYESNEAMVKQRALLRKGTPRWVTVDIRYGTLSLTGEVDVGGMSIGLPPIERLNIANLPIHRELGKILHRLGPLKEILKALSADTILIEPGSTIRFVEERS